MKSQLIPLPSPIKGLYTSASFADQPPLTMRDCLNVRCFEPQTGQVGLGQRSGLSKFMPSTVAGAHPVQDINVVSVTGPFPPTPADGVGAFAYPYGDAGGDGLGVTVAFYGAATDFWRFVPKLLGTYGICRGLVWDTVGNLYTASTSGAVVTVAMTPLSALVEDLQQDGADITAGSYPVSWTATIAATVVDQIGMAVGGGRLWVASWVAAQGFTILRGYNLTTGALEVGPVSLETNTTPAVAGAGGAHPSTATNWICYCNGVLCLGWQDARPAPTAGNLTFYNVATATPTYVTTSNYGAYNLSIVDIATDGTQFFIVAHSIDGFGVTQQGSIYRYTTAGVESQLVELANKDVSSCCYEPVTGYVLLGYYAGAFDVEARSATTLASLGTGTSGLFASNKVLGIRPDGGGGFIITGTATVGGNTGLHFLQGTAVSAYTGHTSLGPTNIVASVPRYAAAYNPAYHPAPPSNVGLRILSVSNGSVARISTAGSYIVGSGSGALSSTRPVVFSAQLGQALYFCDGTNYKKYDIATDTMLSWTASVGSLPLDSANNAASLMAVWRNRMVLAGFPKDPFNWFMSAKDDPTNWNYNPSPALETEAVAGNNTNSVPAGMAQDITTAIIPYSDELLIFGQRRSIFQMTGDPAAGGRIDLVSPEVGMAWGRPFCLKPDGTLFFMSSRGSIYKFVPGSIPVPISEPINYLVAGIDLSTHLVRMAYDERGRGFHVFVTNATETEEETHYFYDLINEAWLVDELASTAFNPRCCTSFDSDVPGERGILIGCLDGYVRVFDYTALDDDGVGITSYAYLGPIQDKRGMAMLLNDLQVTLDDSAQEITWTVQGAESAQKAFTAPRTSAGGHFTAGRNRSPSVRVAGHALYVKLASEAKPLTSWAVEDMKVYLDVSESFARQRMW